MAGYQDDDLIRDFRNALPEAFKELYHRFYQKLYFTSVKLIANREEAKDITIVTLNKLFFKTQDFDTLPEIAGFLFTTCRNECYDYNLYLKKVTDGKNRLLSNLLQQEDLVNDQLDAEDLYALHKHIESLPDRQRLAIQLLYLNRVKYRQAAKTMNISVAALIKLRKNGLLTLRALLRSRPAVEVFALWIFLFWSHHSLFFEGNFPFL